MKALDLIRFALQTSGEATERLVADMRDAAMTRPTARAKGGGGNHPLWTLGHLAMIEGGVTKLLLGGENPLEHWKPLFWMGTEPTDDPGIYPSFDEVLRTFRELRAKNLRLLDEIGEGGLDFAPKYVPPGFEKLMRTAGHTLLVIALHNMLHNGQLADARRAAGRPPLM